MSAWDIESYERVWTRQFSCALVDHVLVDKSELWLTFADTTLIVMDAMSGAPVFVQHRGCSRRDAGASLGAWSSWCAAVTKQTMVVPRVQYSMVDFNMNAFVAAIYPTNIIQLSVWDDIPNEAPTICWETDLDSAHRSAMSCVTLTHVRAYTCSVDGCVPRNCMWTLRAARHADASSHVRCVVAGPSRRGT